MLKYEGYEARGQKQQFALSMLEAFYGPTSVQLRTFKDSINALSGKQHSGGDIENLCTGVIFSTIADAKAGLITNLRAQIEGEVLGDLIALAKIALEDKSDPSMHVAAVLVAAAYEDALRRLASEQAGVTGRPKLDQVITSLKDASLLKGGEISTAVSYLKFRNDSLHADWSQVYRAQVEGCVMFVESLLLKHFS